MENLRQSLKLLFYNRSGLEVLERLSDARTPARKLCDKCLDAEWFRKAYREDECGYTLDQIDNIFNHLRDCWMFSEDALRRQYKWVGNDSVFNVLLHFSTIALTEQNGQPVCRFDSLLRWNDLSALLGEDILTTSYLASKDIVERYQRKSFVWNHTIGHNNMAMNALLARPMADLHAHLKGSSLNFELNWLSLMNFPKGWDEEFKRIKVKQVRGVELSNEKYSVSSLYVKVIKAAAIRYILFNYIMGRTVGAEENLKRDIVYNKSDGRCKLSLSWLCDCINGARFFCKDYDDGYGKTAKPDYAIVVDAFTLSDMKFPLFTVLSGERHLMYKMFKYIYSDSTNAEMANLFYAYLLLKAEFRRELVQLNEHKGFDNFNIYEARKELFIREGSVYEDLIPQLAVYGFLWPNRNRYMEVRITPKTDADKLEENIIITDNRINKQKFIAPNGRRNVSTPPNANNKRYRYILHYIKRPDDGIKAIGEQNRLLIGPRHDKLRKQVKKETLATYRWRNRRFNQNIERIVGIDAANSECVCRPEVFAEAFRFFKKYNASNREQEQHVDMHFTYHVGEDFHDVVDGLRAVDEVIKFLNFSNGDRIGHALVLGVDVLTYYKRRNNTVVMSKQDFLDNVVWMYVRGGNLPEFASTKIELEMYFETYFREIYEDSWKRLVKESLESKMQSHLDGYCKEKISLLYKYITKEDICIEQNPKENYKDYYRDEQFLTIRPSIIDYYQSWLLRGNSPNRQASPTIWGQVRENDNIEVRGAKSNPNALGLFHLYHSSDKEYRKRSYCSTQVKVSDSFVRLVERLQKIMLCEIERLGISIETNPTSNRKIGEFDLYKDHPIFKFYNIGIQTENPLQGISVSINTDDKGVFATSLEREFSLVAAALEKRYLKGEQQNPPRIIYDWLDKIRNMAFEQKFYRNNNSRT